MIYCPPNPIHQNEKQHSASNTLGELPEWDLSDLYENLESGQLRTDLQLSIDNAIAFEQKYKSHLDGMLIEPSGADQLAQALKDYEALQDLLGKLMSYAGLLYAGNSNDPTIVKFFGDTQDKITSASTHLLFFELELNRFEEDRLEKAMQSSQALAYYRPVVDRSSAGQTLPA